MSEPKSRPIIFSAESVRAILAGTKTQTRRVMKPQPPEWVKCWNGTNCDGDRHVFCERDADDDCMRHWPEYNTDKGVKCPFGKPGDRLWVREKWRYGAWDVSDAACLINYEDGTESPYFDLTKFNWKGVLVPESVGEHWRSPMFMPRWASRLTLEIVKVRCERLQEIGLKDTLAEGIGLYDSKNSPCKRFQWHWDEINAKRGFPWQSNPWVWVLEFKLLQFEKEE
jgi:hypothetical protein